MSMRRLPTAGRKSARTQLVKGDSLPPPVGGLNARDALSNMAPADALILENIFPSDSFADLRKGHTEHADTETGLPIDTVVQWAGPTSNKLLAATATDIYDATNPGATGAAVVTGQSNGRALTTMFTTSGGAFLVWCNGADDVLNFDGTTWTTPAITGVASDTLNYVCSHKSRLWFVQEGSTDAWYLPTLSIAGAATKFPLGAIFQLGGYLLAIESVSQDSGNGQDDYLCFFSSNGELAVYQGTDPAAAATWELVGRFALSRPVPFRPALKVGGDIALTTDEGVISVMKSLNMDKAALAKASITGKIAPLFNSLVKAYRGNYGWQSISYPQGKYAIFNIPVAENTRQIQLVMNTLSGAWCSFNGMNANCWALLGADLYFGGNDGRIMLADTGYMDDGAAILGRYKGAFNYLGNRGTNKYPTMARPVYQSNGSPSISFGIDVDFGDQDPGSTLDVPAVISGWDAGLWDDALWSGENNYITDWQTVGGIGYCISPRMNVLVRGQSFRLNSVDLQSQIGGPL
jgi:hypothetical protein